MIWGGRFGDGPVEPEAEGVFFKEDWHRGALALTLACGALGTWNIDRSRHARECLAPKDYARFHYYEKWIAALTDLLVADGHVTEQELRAGVAEHHPLVAKALRGPNVAGVLAKGAPADRPSDVAQAFQPGDPVKTLARAGNRQVDGGHTRLPSYAAGARGKIVKCHGTHILPDSSAHDLGEAAEPLYAVAFSATELWVHPEHPNDEVILDLWQSYLEPAL